MQFIKSEQQIQDYLDRLKRTKRGGVLSTRKKQAIEPVGTVQFVAEVELVQSEFELLSRLLITGAPSKPESKRQRA
jgi:hypothetical protein